MSHPADDPPSRDRSRPVALLAMVAAVAAVAGAGRIYQVSAPQKLDGRGIVSIELGGRNQPYPLPNGTTRALWWDLVFIGGYGIALLLGIWLLARLLPDPKWHRRRSFAYTAAVVTIGADLLENMFLFVAGYLNTTTPWLRNGVLDGATAASVLKFSAAIPATALALTGLGLTFARLFQRRGKPRATLHFRRPKPVDGDQGVTDPAWPKEAADDRTRWRNAYNVPGMDGIDARHKKNEEVIGVCLSGGGIRSASVALGALQTMATQLRSAQFLVSVSGGGYVAGAFQQALTAADPAVALPGSVLRHPKDTFLQGGVGEDHVRRHSSYLADTAGRMSVALAMLVHHMMLSLALLFGPAIVGGVLAGWFYSSIPLANLATLKVVATEPSEAAGSARFHTPFPDVRIGALAALAGVTIAATLAWLLSQWAATHSGWVSWRIRASGAARNTAVLAVAVAMAAIVVPAMAWGAAWLLAQARGVTHIAIGGSVISVTLTYVASLAAVAWRKRTTIGGQASGLFNRDKSEAVTAAVPNGVLQLLLVIITVTVLGVSWLLLFASMILTAGDRAALWTAVGVAAVVIVLGSIVDETTLSLHPFYRRRLASAFAVRAVRRADNDQLVAVPYEPTERTTLSKYGQVDPAHRADFPRVVFAATANITGENRTPPGLNAVSYTFASDWVGGPDVGWVATADLENVAPPRLQRDLTVQGAVALSGAAFASAMGRGARFTQVLLAVTGARLGAWMPNPRFVIDTYTRPQDWDQPRLPKVRRLSYLLRELFNVHPYDTPLLQITDGGHYENLGLVELFRRRCTRIYCIDASGDSPPTATTLAEALTLAEQELGVQVTLTDPWLSEPGRGEPVDPKDPLSVLNPRLSKTPLIEGTFTYPAEAGLVGNDRKGQLIVAKALLWSQLPYPLLSYAAKHPVFPHDSTGDQWFDNAQFAAYTELGRQLGLKASDVPPMRRPSATRPPPPRHEAPEPPSGAAPAARRTADTTS